MSGKQPKKSCTKSQTQLKFPDFHLDLEMDNEI